MRILLTVHSFPPQGRAGCQLYTLYLARCLRAGGHAVHVMHGEDAGSWGVKRRECDGVPCTVVCKPSRFSRRWLGEEADARVEGVFREVLQEFQPDVVHVNHLLGLSLNLPQIADDAGVPVVFTLHDYWLHCVRLQYLMPGNIRCDGPDSRKCGACCRKLYARFPRPRRSRSSHGVALSDAWHWLTAPFRGAPYFRRRQATVRKLIDHVSLFIAPSRFLAETVIRHGIPRHKIVAVDYGMVTSVFENVVDRRDATRLRFGYVGTITEHKGVGVLLEAFDGFDGAELVIYGKERRRLFNRYQHVLRQPNVMLGGVLHDEQKASAFGRLDALIVPSLWFENSPLVIHEAFLAGVPVVTSNLGGMKELVPQGAGGVLFEAGDAAELRKKLADLCGDPERLEELRRTIPHVKSMDEHLPELLGLYERVMKRPRPAAEIGLTSRTEHAPLGKGV
jgi:glycosyltransferase involved in cell wall biosynthesis